jgi:glycosylphosphatidylinositol transamidase (GPIT) subunit GPI8
MKHPHLQILFWLVFLGHSFFLRTAYAQTYYDDTPVRKININRKPKLPPVLTVDGVLFNEPSGNHILDADEEGTFALTLRNIGKGDALHIRTTADIDNSSDVRIGPAPEIEKLKPGESFTIQISIKADHSISSSERLITFSFNEQNGFEPADQKVKFSTLEFQSPRLVLSEQLDIEDPNNNGRIENLEVVKVTVRIINAGKGQANKVVARVKTGQNVFMAAESKTEFDLADITPGGVKDISFSAYANNRATSFPVFISVEESYHMYGVAQKQLSLTLNRQVVRANELVVQGEHGKELVPNSNLEIEADIDHAIASSPKSNPNGVALVIGIRDYQSENIPPVEFARRDAQLVREYLVNVLGFDRKNILPQNPEEVITLGKMKSFMRQKLPSYLRPNGESNVFIYYTGHGAPNSTSQQPYFVPADGDPNFVSDDNAYRMSDFYKDVSQLNAKTKFVVIDACFSGQEGNGSSIIRNASPIYLKVDNPLVGKSNCTIFQSSEFNQVSNWYPEKRHSMFTYFFLKGLRGDADLNKDGKITVDELGRFINDPNSNLPYVSQREMERKQTAVITGDPQNVLVQQR